MSTYRDAGVDLTGADRHVANIAEAVQATWGDRVVGSFGGFAAGVSIPAGYHDPILMMSTDGVGTKLELARITDDWSGIGFDLVAMCVDDLAVTGAQPIGFVDYIAVGRLSPSREQRIVASIAEACAFAGCPLIGGETAEHPGVMEEDAVDVAGTAIGLVERANVLVPETARPGDPIIGLRSPNLRSNGFSLIRKLLGERVVEHATTLLQPSVIYSPDVLAAIETGLVRSGAHITGGGIAANLERVLPDSLGADIDTATWDVPEAFHLVAGFGVAREEMFRVFNMGVGFALIVDPEGVDELVTLLAEHTPTVIGRVVERTGVRIN